MKGYQLKINMKHAKPPVWRRIQIPQDMTFYQLHQTIQELFGWMDEHLHEFSIPSLGIHIREDQDDPDSIVEDSSLFEFLKDGLLFLYIYDFGDYWEHSILVEKEVDMMSDHPVLLKWKGDNFAEDAGNIDGYEALCAKANDLQDPDHHEIKEWLLAQHVSFDPQAVEARLSKIRLASIEPPLEQTISEALQDAVLNLRHLLWDRNIVDLSLVIIEHGSTKRLIGLNRVQEDITLQIYENETTYLQGVDYVVSHAQGNLYADAVCIIMTNEEIPLKCWKTQDKQNMAKKMEPGSMPKDLQKESALQTIKDLQAFTEILSGFGEMELPSYHTNECLHAKWEHPGWNIAIEPIRLHPLRKQLHLEEDQLKRLKELDQQHPMIFHVDLISLPSEHMNNGKMDVVFVVENADDANEFVLEDEDIVSFQSMNQAVIQFIGNYMYECGVPLKIIVNNENMRFMLSGVCNDLEILLVIEPFITQLEEEFLTMFQGEDMQVLDTLADMTPEEFYDFMSKMSEQELHDFQDFLQQYMDIEAYEDLFSQQEEEPTKKYDA